MRTVSFLHPGNELMASYRYRTVTPAQQLGAKVNNLDADILIVAKSFDPSFAVELQAQGRKIVADFCDDHFNHPEMGPRYHYLAQVADYCVCPTEAMKARIPASNIAVISDPYEMPEMKPHADGEKLLWFGHNAGMQALEKCKQLPNLSIVTGPKIMKGMIEYSAENLKREMMAANIAIFPTIKGHEYKSPNRVINALRMGLFPACDKHPSYTEFKRFIWQSEVSTGLKWAAEFRNELNELVKAGQDYIRDRYSPETIGAQWKDLLGSI